MKFFQMQIYLYVKIFLLLLMLFRAGCLGAWSPGHFSVLAQLPIGDQLPCRGRSPVAFRVSGIPYSARVPLFKIGHFASRTRWLPCLAPNFAIWPWALLIELVVVPLASRAWFPGQARFLGQLPDSDGFPRISGYDLPGGFARRRAFGCAEF